MELLIILSLILLAVVGFFIFKKMKSSFSGSTTSKDLEILEVQVHKSEEEHYDVQTAALAAEHMFASLHGLLRVDAVAQEQVSFEFVAVDGGIRFYVAVPPNISKFVESQIYAQYPTAHISKVEDYAPSKFKDGDGEFEVATLTLKKANFFPIKTFRDFERDSLSSVTSALSEATSDENLWFQVVIKPIADVWQGEGFEYVQQVREGTTGSGTFMGDLPGEIIKEFSQIVSTFFKALVGRAEEPVKPGGLKVERKFLNSNEEVQVEAIEEKLSRMGFEVNIRLLSRAQTYDRADRLLRSLIASLQQFSTVQLNSIEYEQHPNSENKYNEYKTRSINSNNTFVLNIAELASIYHLPSEKVETPGVLWVGSKKAEPPANLPTTNCNYIGEVLFRDKKMRFGISNEGEDRVRHMYLIGKTGTGKSTFFKNMIVQDILAGHGVGVVDPHGDLIEDILDYIPENRLKDVVMVDPSDTERPVGINVLEIDDQSQKNLMASALVSSMAKQFDYSWGPRLEYLLNYSVLTLLEVPGTSILGITRLLNDMNYQKYILHQIKDPVVLDFWEEEYKAMRGNQRLITEAVAPIQNKINRFLSSTTIRNILGQRKSTIDFWEIMNSGKILLLNLSKGKIGEDNANLLGALLVSRINFMAMQRIKIDPQQRKPFYLYVDEFQNFAGGNFESILSESRKYKLGLHLTHQFTSQLPEELLSAVFGNVGTVAAFSVGAQDAKILETEFSPYFDENDLISLRKFQIYIKLMIDGQTSKPFSATVPRPWIAEESLITKTGNRQKALDFSRLTYGADRQYVEDKIRKWVEFKFDKGVAVAQEYNSANAGNVGERVEEVANPISEPQPEVQNPEGSIDLN